MNCLIFLDVKPEDHDNLVLLLSKVSIDTDTEKRPMTNAERCKKYRDSKKNCDRDMSECVADMSNVSTDTEKREEEKEGILPLDSPSSLSSFPPHPPINNPITPFNPPLSEEKEGEKKERLGADVEKASRTASRRGELKSFGAHVKLSEKEFLSLQEKFGYEKALEKIEWMNNYIGEDPKRERVYQSRNHYLTLLNWDRMDQERKQKPQAAEQPKEETWMEVAERIQRERDAKKEVIDL